MKNNQQLIIKQKQGLIKAMPSNFSKFKKLSNYGLEIYSKEQLIEIVINSRQYIGKCFIDIQKRDMEWKPSHRWYVFIDEADDCYSYDLLAKCLVRLIPTDVQLNTFYEKKLKQIIKRGTHHLKQTQKAYLDLEELRGK